jgi:hypothetical protein
MATTEIATVQNTVSYPCLQPNSRQARIIQSNLDGEPMREMDLVRVKTPLGGSTTWQIDVDGNIESTDELQGLLVGEGKRGYLWPSLDPSEQRPILESRDLLVARRLSDDLGPEISPDALEKYRIGDRLYDWAAISISPEFGFGSSKGGAKRVKESRILAILRQGDVWPVLVTVGPGSLPTWLPFRKRLPAFHYECVIGLKLQKAKGAGGQPYSQIVPRVVAQVSEEEGEVARRLYTEALTRMFGTFNGAAAADKGDDDTPF